MVRKFSWYTIVMILLGALLLTMTSCSGELDGLLGSSEFSVGDIGPAGGYVFYDKGRFDDGWRYLEAAPAGWFKGLHYPSDPMFIFGYYRFGDVSSDLVVGTETGIGKGKSNTEKLLSWVLFWNEVYIYPTGDNLKTKQFAARMCADYVGGGYDDWFLPSKDELNQMREKLYVNNLGGFSDWPYWSSSEYDENKAWAQYFLNGNQGGIDRDFRYSLRPIRAF